MPSTEMLQCLESCDIEGIKRLWAQVRPAMPAPQTDHEALTALHYARTCSQMVAFRLRSYSHRWLSDNGLPSGLPDELKPRAERQYPRIVSAVGISCSSKSPYLRPLADRVQKAMASAVEDAYADGRTDAAFVKQRMHEARISVLKDI